MTRSVGVIGAGPGGLAAAMLLARAGAKVTVHERTDRLGGRSGTIAADVGRGLFRFDIGPTFFLYPQVLAEIFATCGRRLEDHVELIRLDPQYHLVFEAGGDIQASPDLGRLMQQVARIAPADAAALPRFMADNRAKLTAFKPVLETPFDKLRHYVRPAMLRSLPLLRPHRSVDRDLASYFSDPRVRLAFSFQSKYLGMSPFRCPSLFTILAFLEYEFGVYHVRGGTGAVMAAMARVAESMGVRIQLNDPVEQVLLEGRKAVGLRTRFGTQRYDAVVVNADFAQAMKTLVPSQDRRRWSDRRIERKKFSCSTFMLYLGIEGRYDALSHHTIYLAKDYRRNIGEIEQGKAPPTEPSFYVQNACVTDPSLAPPGHSTLYVLVPVSHRVGVGIDWETERGGFRAMILQRLERIGVSGLEKRIRFEKVMTPAGWEHDLNVFRGATFNLSHKLSQMLYFRPHNRFEDLDRVYLVGGGTHPGSGLPVIFESARITTRLLAEDLGLHADWHADLAMPEREPAPAIAEAL